MFKHFLVFLINVRVNGKDVVMEVDTHSAVARSIL